MNIDELPADSAHELRDLIAAGKVSAIEVAQLYLDRLTAYDGFLAAFCAVEPETVLQDARALDDRFASEGPVGPLHGLPIAVKDLIFTKGLRTAGGSPVYERFVPDEDDVSVERLRDAGAIILGKTNTAEFGFSANQTANQVGGVTRNPWGVDRTPGGSSGGSGAAMAAHLAAMALGSDGGGSIRIPSAFCGVYGLKPTFGRVPLYPGCRDTRYPGFSGWESLEHIGPMTTCVQDAALLLDVIAGYDHRDRHALPSPESSFHDSLLAAPADLAGLRIAWSADWADRELVAPDVRAAFLKAVEAVEAAGGHVVEAAPERPTTLQTFGAFVVLDADQESLRAMIREHPGQIGPRLEMLMQRDWTGEELGVAARERKQLYAAVEGFFQEYDAWLTPTVPVTAFPLGCEGPEQIGDHVLSEEDRPRAIMGFSYPFNLTGHPAASVPIGRDSEGLPIGLQVVGARLSDAMVLRISLALEAASGVVDDRPELKAAR